MSVSGVVTVTDNQLTVFNTPGGTNRSLSRIEITDYAALSRSTLKAPSDVVATASSSTSIDVRWKDESDNETHYAIERSFSPNGPWLAVYPDSASKNIIAANAGLFVDTTADPNTTYYYQVAALNGATAAQIVSNGITTPHTGVLQSPYNPTRTAWTTDTVIEAEDFDSGGDGVANSHDLIGGNAGGYYRSGNIDVGYNVQSKKSFVGWTRVGEWMEYTVISPTAGTHRIEGEGSSVGEGGTFELFDNGHDLNSKFEIKNTGSFADYQRFASRPFDLIPGNHVIRIKAKDFGATSDYLGDIDWLKVSTVTRPTLAAAVDDHGDVVLSWQTPSFGYKGYEIFCRLSGTSDWGISIAIVPTESSNYVDQTAKASTKYDYMLRTVYTAADGGPYTAESVTSVTTPNEVYALILNSPDRLTEGQTISVTSNSYLMSNLETHSYNWSVMRNGIPFTLDADVVVDEQALVFGVIDDGVYQCTLSVDNGQHVTTSLPIDVKDAPAVATPKVVSQDPATLSVVVAANFIDRGLADTHTAVIRWGDGTESIAAVDEQKGIGNTSSSHTYDEPGEYSAVLLITDQKSGTSTTTFVIIVTDTAAGNFPARVTSAYSDEINLAWQVVVGASSYEIFRGASEASMSPIASVSGSQTHFNDLGPSTNTTYYYTIKANVGNPNSALDSNMLVVRTLTKPLTPTNFVTSASPDGTVSMSWNAVPQPVDGYIVMWGKIGSLKQPIAFLPSEATSFTDGHPSEGTSEYSIVSYLADSRSNPSAPQAVNVGYGVTGVSAMLTAYRNRKLDVTSTFNPLYRFNGDFVNWNTEPDNGRLTIHQNGTFEYEPDHDFHGLDSFSYTIKRGSFESEVETVFITVVNDDPVAHGFLDIGSAGYYQEVHNWLAGPNLQGSGLSLHLASSVSSGSLDLNEATGEFRYQPSGTESGNVQFTYYLSDGTKNSNIASADFYYITPDDDIHTALKIETGSVTFESVKQGDVFHGNGLLRHSTGGMEDNTYGYHLLRNPTVNTSPVKEPNNGTLALRPDGTFDYIPNPGFVGVDEFTYSVSGNRRNLTPYATVRFFVAYSGPDDVSDSNGSTALSAPGVWPNRLDRSSLTEEELIDGLPPRQMTAMLPMTSLERSTHCLRASKNGY